MKISKLSLILLTCGAFAQGSESNPIKNKYATSLPNLETEYLRLIAKKTIYKQIRRNIAWFTIGVIAKSAYDSRTEINAQLQSYYNEYQKNTNSKPAFDNNSINNNRQTNQN